MLKLTTCAKTAALIVAMATGALLQTGKAAAQADDADLRTLTVAGGCFWCVEADFEKVRGVEEVVSGYTGGTVPDPTYEEVVRGGTGHYEAVEIRYDPDEVTYRQLLDLFFRSIDPTDPGGQFCDRGPSYRTAVFVETEERERIAKRAKAEAQAALGQEIVTPVVDAGPFYEAEDYHQDYYKSDERLAFSSVGLAVPKRVAYERYRDRCGRDERVRELWGDDAPFVPQSG